MRLCGRRVYVIIRLLLSITLNNLMELTESHLDIILAINHSKRTLVMAGSAINITMASFGEEDRAVPL